MSSGQPYSPRHATVQVAAAILLSAIVAACGSTSVTDVSGPGPVRCNATLSVQPPAIPADGGPASISISAARDCTWSARSEVSWLQLASTSGQGDATVGVTALGNPQAGARSGGIMVNDQRLAITQEGRGCTITLNTPTDPVPATGGRRTLAINTLAGCAWTVTSSAEWLVPLTTTGSGQGNISYDVQANSGSVREASLTVGGTQVVINQAAAPVAPPCTFTIDRPLQDFPAAGGQTTVSVTTQANCAWTVTGGESWLTVQTASGTGSGTARYTVTPNASLTGRQTTLTIAGRVHTVTQQGVLCTISLTPGSQSFPAAGGSSSIAVSTLAICPWTASSNAAWVTVGTPTGIGSGSVPFTVLPNEGTGSRSAVITIGGQAFQVQQNGAPTCTYEVTPLTRTVGASASSATVRVTTQNGCAWTASSGEPWLTIAPGSATGNGSADITYNVAANTSTASRLGAVTVQGRQHVVTQQGAAPACTYSITPAERTFPTTGGNGTITLTTGATCTWTAVPSAGWITITNPTGTGPATIQYQISADGNRTGTITINGQVHTIRQGNP